MCERLPPIRIGKITSPKLSKNTPKWIWLCACSQCEQRPVAETLHGPFQTRRDAVRDAEENLSLLFSAPQGSA
jgi:hypothetical protein